MPTQKKPHREVGKIPLFEMSEKMEPTVRGNPVAKESEQGTPGARDPDVRGNLLRHPYSTLLGDRSPTEYENLKTTLVRAGDVGEIVLLDGAVISDWDRYRIGMELELTLRTIAYPGDDSHGVRVWPEPATDPAPCFDQSAHRPRDAGLSRPRTTEKSHTVCEFFGRSDGTLSGPGSEGVGGL